MAQNNRYEESAARVSVEWDIKPWKGVAALYHYAL
jgi:hypothetical protein